LNNIYSSSKVNYDESVCYIDFFEYIDNSYISDLVINKKDDYKEVKFNVFNKNEDNIDCILGIINRNYFEIIIAQQKLVYYSSMYDFSIENKNSHSGLGKTILKLYFKTKKII